MGKLAIQDVKVDPVLTNLSVEYSNEAYVAEQIMPVAEVSARSGLYYKYDKSKFRNTESYRAPGTRANSVDYGLTTATYGPVLEHALETEVPKELIDQADDALDPLKDAANNVMERHLISRETELATTMQNGSVMTQKITLSSSTDKWSDYANSDPIGDIQTGKDTIHGSIFKEPNTLVLPRQTWVKLKHHPQIKAELGYSRSQVVKLSDLADILEIERVLIAGAGQNTADEGQTDAMSYIWGKNAWLLYTASNPQLRQVAFGFTLKLKGGIMTEKRWDDDNIQWIVRTRDTRHHLITSVEASYAMFSVVA